MFTDHDNVVIELNTPIFILQRDLILDTSSKRVNKPENIRECRVALRKNISSKLREFKNKSIKNEKSKRFWWEDLCTRCHRVTMFEIIIQQWKKKYTQKEEKALTDLIFYQLTFPTFSYGTEGSRWCRACVQKNETTCSDILNYISTCIDWVHVEIADRVCFVR